MAVGDQYRRISPADQLVFDSTGALVGIKSGLSGNSEGRMLPEAVATATRDSVSGAGIAGQQYVLKAFTGRSQLTGGTVATKTALMEVPIPDGWLSRLDCRMDIEASFNYTNNANTKSWGMALGTGSAGGGALAAAVDIRAVSATTTASISDKVVIQRNAETPTRLYLALPNNSRVFGSTATTGSTVGVLASASINPDATGVSLWIWGRLDTANTDQVSLEHLYVALQRAAA